MIYFDSGSSYQPEYTEVYKGGMWKTALQFPFELIACLWNEDTTESGQRPFK